MKELKLEKLTFSLMDDDGFIGCTYHSSAVIFKHDILEVIEKGKQIFGDSKKYFLVDFSKLGSVSEDARRFFASKEGATNVGAIAFIISNEANREVAIEFLSQNQPHFPSAVFDKESPAIDWLKHVKNRVV